MYIIITIEDNTIVQGDTKRCDLLVEEQQEKHNLPNTDYNQLEVQQRLPPVEEMWVGTRLLLRQYFRFLKNIT